MSTSGSWGAARGALCEAVSDVDDVGGGWLERRVRPRWVRLALIYALLDRSTTINLPHLDAALGLWRYAPRLHRLGLRRQPR